MANISSSINNITGTLGVVISSFSPSGTQDVRLIVPQTSTVPVSFATTSTVQTSLPTTSTVNINPQYTSTFLINTAQVAANFNSGNFDLRNYLGVTAYVQQVSSGSNDFTFQLSHDASTFFNDTVVTLTQAETKSLDLPNSGGYYRVNVSTAGTVTVALSAKR